MRAAGGAVLLLGLLLFVRAQDGGRIRMAPGCFRDVECGKGEYCDTAVQKGCVAIPRCDAWQAREGGNDYGDCVRCAYDQQCNWTAMGEGARNSHQYCWRGDGLCRERAPFTLRTYAWERAYSAKVGFVDTLVPEKTFVQGETVCFVVATPFPREFAQYLRVRLARVSTCALRQTEYEALLRLQEAARVEQHHGVTGVHRHHGIIPYDAADDSGTGCQTSSHGQLNRYDMEAPAEQGAGVGDYAPKNASFVIVDSASGASALCVTARAISPQSIPVYIQAEVTVEPQADAIARLLSRHGDSDDVVGLLTSYGIAVPGAGTRFEFPDGPVGDVHARHTTVVVSDPDYESYVVCPSGHEWNGHHGWCESNDWDDDQYFWYLIFSTLALVLGGVVALTCTAQPRSVIVI